MELALKVIPFWVELTGLAFCVGGLVCYRWVVREADETPALDVGRVRERMIKVVTIAAYTAIAGSAADLLVRTAGMTGKTAGAAFLFVPTAIAKTHLGHAWLIRMAGLFLLLILGGLLRTGRSFRGLIPLMLLASLVIAFTESATGHAADKGDFTLPEIIDWLHLGAGLVWAGGLFMLSLVILPYFNERANSDDRVQAAAVGRFSFIAGCAATAVCVTSLYNAWVYVGSLAALVSPGYGWTVMAKMVLLTLLLAVAGFHRFVVVPRLHELAEGLASPRRYVAAAIRAFAQTYDRTSLRKLFMLGVRIEVVLILCILLCAAALRQQIPARHVSHNLENGAGQHAH